MPIANIATSDSEPPSFLWLLLAAILCASAVWHVLRPLPADVTYLLACAERLLQGDVLYRDILETTPPLILWIMSPAAWLASHSGFDLQVIFVLAVTTLSALALVLVDALYRRVPSGNTERTTLLFAIAVSVSLFPAGSYGQREHLAVILLIPYLASAAALASGCNRTGSGLAIVAGLAAGVAVSFKPTSSPFPR